MSGLAISTAPISDPRIQLAQATDPEATGGDAPLPEASHTSEVENTSASSGRWNGGTGYRQSWMLGSSLTFFLTAPTSNFVYMDALDSMNRTPTYNTNVDESAGRFHTTRLYFADVPRTFSYVSLMPDARPGVHTGFDIGYGTLALTLGALEMGDESTQEAGLYLMMSAGTDILVARLQRHLGRQWGSVAELGISAAFILAGGLICDDSAYQASIDPATRAAIDDTVDGSNPFNDLPTTRVAPNICQDLTDIGLSQFAPGAFWFLMSQVVPQYSSHGAHDESASASHWQLSGQLFHGGGGLTLTFQ